MASDSVGQIGLDLVVNKKQFDKQMQGITGLAKKAGAAIAAAFAVNKLINFGKQCIELGSDLAEVQNVVDVTFPALSKQVDKFARNAAASFGLSETMAKKFTGTFGAMAKAFGFNEQAAYGMSTALTGLAGDVASFYNISQDEAYTKLKSVFTGETESLKDLGIVMTQTALDAYAMANGYGKVTAKMSEGEKVALRYAFVQEQLQLATGDFARTSDGWANQIRILSLQFDSLKASIGQGLINLFTPIIKTINIVIGKLITMANAFKAFTELITGKKATGAGASTRVVADAADSAAAGYDNTANAAKGAGKAAKKAAKDMKSLMGFDQINKLSEPSGSGDGGSGGGGGGAASGSAIDFGSLAEGETVLDGLNKRLQPLIDKAKELAEAFKDGFKSGIGNDAMPSIERAKRHIEGIKTSLKDIFMDPEVTKAADNWAMTVAHSVGKVAGGTASIGITIAENLLGGADRYLDQNRDYIKTKIAGIFDANAEASEIFGSLATSAAEVLEVFRGEEAKQCTADLIGIFANGALGAVELLEKFSRDVMNLTAKPIIENADKIKEAIKGTLEPIGKVLSTLNKSIKHTFEVMGEAYDEHVKPMFDALSDGLGEAVGTLLDAYNKHIKPVLDSLADKFAVVWTSSIQPTIDKAIEFIGKIADLITALWTNVVQPFIQWLIDTIIPIVAPIFETIGSTIMGVFGTISDMVGGALDVFGGLLDFLTGIFSGDWEKCWQGICSIFTGQKEVLESLIMGLWEAISSVFTFFIEGITGAVQLFWETLTGIVTTASDAITSLIQTGVDFVSGIIRNAGDTIKGIVDGVCSTVSAIVTKISESIKNTVSKVTGSISRTISTICDSIKRYVSTTINNVKNTVSSVINGIKSVISTVMSSIKNGIKNSLDAIKSKFTSIFTSIKETVTKTFKGMWDNIKGVINSILGGVESMANGVVRGINKVIGAMNGLSFDIPDWIPGMGGKTFGFNIPTINEVSLPRLAQGGYVKANTPQLAMIGDNRHQGEVVAPEDKLRQMAMDAVRMAGTSSGSSETIHLLAQILNVLKGLKLSIALDGRDVTKVVKDYINQETRATGVCPIVIV